jgi:hypothetical protein
LIRPNPGSLCPTKTRRRARKTPNRRGVRPARNSGNAIHRRVKTVARAMRKTVAAVRRKTKTKSARTTTTKNAEAVSEAAAHCRVERASGHEPPQFRDNRPLPLRRCDDHGGRRARPARGRLPLPDVPAVVRGLFLCFSVDASAVTITGEITRYRSSAFAERAFCPRCGSHLWFNDVEDGGKPRSYELMPGLFDAARSWPLRSEIYVDRAMASLDLVGDHRRKTRAE